MCMVALFMQSGFSYKSALVKDSQETQVLVKDLVEEMLSGS